RHNTIRTCREASHERTSFHIRIPRHFPWTMGQGRLAGGNTAACMNEFVNYGTRDVSLPKGFTELIEVMHSDQAPGIIRRTTEGLRQLDGYLSTLMSSP